MELRRSKLYGMKNIKLQKSLFTSKYDPNYIKRKDLKKALKLVRGVDTDEIKNNFSKEDVDEILNFYNAVVLDGRYIEEMQKNSKGVANKLNINISKSALEKFELAVSSVLKEMELVQSSVSVVAVAVTVVAVAVIVVVLESTDIIHPGDLIIDRSGLIKL